MSNHGKITSASQLNKVIFRDASELGVASRFTSLFPGLGYAAAYKILQRVYKYGGQPFARDFLAKNYGNEFDAAFGKGNGKAIMHATAGSLIGIGEIVLLPLDVLKIKRQTNPEAFRGRGVVQIVKDEGFGLYRGWGWTAARNAPGSFAVCLWRLRSAQFKTNIYSSSVVLQSPNNTGISSKITTPQPGDRTLSPPSLVQPHLSSSPLPSMSSRPVSKTETLRTQKVASRSLPAWQRKRVHRRFSRDWCPSFS